MAQGKTNSVVAVSQDGKESTVQTTSMNAKEVSLYRYLRQYVPKIVCLSGARSFLLVFRTLHVSRVIYGYNNPKFNSNFAKKKDSLAILGTHFFLSEN